MYSTSSDSDEFYSCSDTVSSNSTPEPSLHTVIGSELFNFAHNFNVVHINAQSIPAHYNDLLASLNHDNIHAICVSETWLKPCLVSSSYSLPGFQLVRNDRIGSTGGGVAIYIRSNIAYKIIIQSSQPPPSDSGEFFISRTNFIPSACFTWRLL